MMEGLKKRTRKAFGLRKKEKDTDFTGSPDKDGVSARKKKTNGAPNGYYGEIDWDRYATPDVDAEGFSLRPGEEGETAPKGKQHFLSSSDSEDEDDKRKFKIKIKPLPSDTAKCAVPSMDELKASVGGLALSPSLRRSPRRSPGSIKRHLSCEEIARPRRSTPTPSPAPETQSERVSQSRRASPAFYGLPPETTSEAHRYDSNRNDGEEIARPICSTLTPSPALGTQSERVSQSRRASPAFYGLPPETTYETHRYDSNRNDVVCIEADAWCDSRPYPDSPLTRSFPTGAPPPLPPKNIPAASQGYSLTDSYADLPNGRIVPSPNPIYLNVQSPASYRGSPVPDLENVFGPMESSQTSEDRASPRWISFNSERPPPPDEPAPPPPSASPPSDSPHSLSSTPDSPCLSPGPPPDEPPPSPPPFSSPPDSPISIISIPPPDEPVPPLPPDFSPVDSPPCIGIDPSLFLDDEILGYSPAPSGSLEYSPAPTSPIPPPLPVERYPRTGVPSPLAFLREEQPDYMASPLGLTPGFRGTPPPLPPLTYRSMVSSPGPCPGSGPSSPARPSTPLSGGSPIPPPLPTRPSSRPKLPPGKPIGDLTRPFSPPVSGSPPPFAPLARAESSSSISSITSLSAGSTPTLGRELNISTTEEKQPAMVWFDHGRFYLSFEGCSRGPSPLTMGAQDTLPVAAAFTETINAYFKGADPSNRQSDPHQNKCNKCVVKITGEMVLSFPAGITRHFASHPSAPVLTFSISNYSRLEQVLPNPQLLCCDTTMSNVDTKEFWVNMPNLMSHLRRVADQKPQATYYNVDMIKYQSLSQVAADGIQSTPLNLAVSWRGDATSTDLRIDYKYNMEAMAAPSPLHNIHFLVPVDGGVHKLQAMIPTATWKPEQQKILWKIPSLSQRSENGGVGALLGRFQLTEGPSKPSQLAVHFTSEGSTLSGCDIQLVGTGYRLSLVKKRFAAGKYLADN
ncbi:SH3-containing GRB2-like protein 3-interacting protein 1 isoform X1 [Oncorhynchus kisutch]|uniref:SH3-containing GRB2-like protein 3-interacting protein 1 isoform X1 n=1 Tax=Oncorhynchus kisutch TaxID=8019 RepID=UPI0012DEE15F|nr:SH3-containing GRB2-like protein 3-interacting protein 1 isoform X1 [Oncorhynchus kisutch]